ncbi:TonB-dependent receptor [Paucibacter sp. APW11]|uniref:TonB-dependent receptor n=1 Tax=Roseateles aquae TaxID=3077235 RepID=A0ABU3PC98_9BURK|nr:TonB-dependent receptor [Paucibacter sp. APW11]MDT8999915.1 TonB-dependent receptor [Paucibacter sp. APW11]
MTPIAAAVSVTLLTSLAANAQQAPKTDNQLDQVVVTGIRASLESAVNIKKNANAVVDAVSAEDVGKLPDTDVGQSLGRIPGVSVGRAFGQGASVSVRGSDPQMTYTTLNGQTVASTGWYDQVSIDRSFNYSLLPPELIGGMEVYKSSQADLTEGGIGGTVIVKTRKPLDLAAGTAYVGARAGKGSISTELNKDVSGLYSWRNASKSFGVLVAGGVEKGEYVRRGIEADTMWSADVTPSTFLQDRKRTALNVNLQARPVENLDLGLNYLNLELTGDNANTSHYIFQASGVDTCTSRNAAGACLTSVATAAKTNPGFAQTWGRVGKMTSESLVLNASYKTDGYRLDVTGGTTKAKGGTDLTTNYDLSSGGPGLPKWIGSIDATGHKIVVSPGASQDVTTANFPTTLAPGQWAVKRAPNSDKEDFFQADLSTNVDWGFVTGVKTGVRSTKHSFNKQQDTARFFDADHPKSAAPGDLYSGTIAMGTPGWSFPKANLGALVDLTYKNVKDWVELRSAYGALEEKNTAAYVMFDFEKDKFHGNFGLRYIHTDATGRSYKFDGTSMHDPVADVAANDGWTKNIVNDSSSYNDFLPSLNLAYDLDKNTIVRFAASSAVTRANFDNMFGSAQNGYNDKVVGNETMNLGSAALKPMKSNQFDLGIEYYYGRGNLVAATVFYKKISNFITTDTLVHQQIGVVDPDSKKDDWTVNRYVNAGGGKIQGLEFQVNHSFDNGFGVAGNYTFSDATAPAVSYQDGLNVFTQSSRHNVNLVGFYETSQYSARLAYNWRSKYMIRETGYYGNRMHDPFGTLDLSLGWNISDKLKLTFEAQNLTKQDDVQYGAADVSTTVKRPLKVGYPAWSFLGETTYRVGVSAKF